MSAFRLATVMALAATVGITASACVYVPTPAFSGINVITQDTIDSIQPGTTTRADILLRLGDPQDRQRDDRVFVYQWYVFHGIFMFGVAPGAGGGWPVPYTHYLAIEFDENSRVRRLGVFNPGLIPNARRRLTEWLDSSDDSDRGRTR